MDSSPSSMDEEIKNREQGGGCVKREKTAAEIRKVGVFAILYSNTFVVITRTGFPIK